MFLPEIPEAAAWAIYFSPIASFVVIAAALRRAPLAAGRVTILAVFVSWLLSLWVLDSVVAQDGEALAFDPHPWMELFGLRVEFGLGLDGLSAVMIVVVTSVSLLVQIYSTGYMAGDGGYARYFAYMSLFTAAMLGLVMASSLLQLFIHWELVGLTSYLLVGFWFDRPAAAAAAKKAFIVTRMGDVGFLIAVVLIWTKTGGMFDIGEINEATHHLSGAIVTGFVLGLLSGAAGKSAQFPLHFWLPDAMEGPTPVSSLIHSATMVAAGVYLLARFFPSIEAAPHEVSTTIAWVGGFTAIFAASMGVVMTDIKRVLAYSTISQLGYMVMAIGLGGYVAAVFHLFTHAFFKSLLFQGSGSVNHATHTFDMRLMGGLRRSMPITFATFVIGSLSLAGVFPLAGFWSKDEILLDAWKHDQALFWVGVVTAFLTALYMFRAIFMTFFGEYRGGGEPEHGPGAAGEHEGDAAAGADAHGAHHGGPHESPVAMWAPLVIFCVPAIFFGFWAFADFGQFVEGALDPAIRHFEGVKIEGIVLGASLIAALGGIGTAAAIYYFGSPDPDGLRRGFGVIHELIAHKYFVDEIAEDGVVRRGLDRGVGRWAAAFDARVVDGAVNGAARLVDWLGAGVRRLETGQVQAYTSVYVAGVVITVLALFVFGADVLDR